MNMIFDFIGLFLFIAGFIIGLGAVTVIDIHGFLGRKSSYWTEATIRTHKITKPLIWLGMFLALVGGTLFYRHEPFVGIPVIHAALAAILVLNGLFLSFVVSPFLLNQERTRRSGELLPSTLQTKIIFSFLVSFLGWWGALALLVLYILN